MALELMGITELSRQLASLASDKDKVKLLLKTIEDNIQNNDKWDRIEFVSYSLGYLRSLLVKHGLCDWEG